MSEISAIRKADATSVWLEPHNPDWSRLATAESARLAGALGDALIRIEHIGSTSVPGIAAKPIVDLLPIVRSLAAADARQTSVENLGYLWRGEFGIEGRRYCVLEREGVRLVHAHIFQYDNNQVRLNLAFRDYLRAHPAEASAYEGIKREAAAAHPRDSIAYNDHKSAWIRACQQRALQWSSELS